MWGSSGLHLTYWSYWPRPDFRSPEVLDRHCGNGLRGKLLHLEGQIDVICWSLSFFDQQKLQYFHIGLEWIPKFLSLFDRLPIKFVWISHRIPMDLIRFRWSS